MSVLTVCVLTVLVLTVLVLTVPFPAVPVQMSDRVIAVVNSDNSSRPPHPLAGRRG